MNDRPNGQQAADTFRPKETLPSPGTPSGDQEQSEWLTGSDERH